MAPRTSVDQLGRLREQIEAGEPDLLRHLLKTFTEALMSAEADSLWGAEYGQRCSERANRRNGYPARGWDTRAGSVERSASAPGGTVKDSSDM